jgi:glycosyltransferase involved in cell wall biosynthesis
MRILLWHGYLLDGTGSNIYTQAVAREWAREGHDLTVVCQEPHPERFNLAGASVVRPELPERILPVFVIDRYEGLEARKIQELTAELLDRYTEANAAALRAYLPADLIFANHVVPGGPVAAAAAADGTPFAVKAHGSELEYSMRGDSALIARARRALAGAGAVYVGSDHIRAVLEDVVGPVARVHEVPPGVDTEKFVPQARDDALRDLLDECRRDPPNPGNAEERLPDEGNADCLAAFFDSPEPTVLYFGKLLRNKGVHLLLDALRELGTRALIVGFGDYRHELEAQAPSNAVFTGPLEHRHLVHLVPLVDVTVVPSIFPEAFGMVAAEAASAGCPPLVADHSGLAEVAAAIAAEYPPADRALTSFQLGDSSDLGRKLDALLSLPEQERRALGLRARKAVVERFSWPAVARRLLEPFE